MTALDPVDSMRQFWIAFAGEEPSGPYTLDQVGAMFRSGQIYATAQVCEEGESAWRPVTNLRREFPSAFSAPAAPRIAAPVAQAYHPGVFRILALFFGIIGAHNFYVGDVAAGLLKLLLLFVCVAAPVLAGPFGVVLSWILALAALVVLVVEIIRAESLPATRV
jgi:TM2 domain-containing membrane protein YozV